MFWKQESLLNYRFTFTMDKVILKMGKKRGRSEVRKTTNMDRSPKEVWKLVLKVRNLENGVEDFYMEWLYPEVTNTLNIEVEWNLEDGTKVEAIC